MNLAREMGVGPEEGMSLRVLGQALVASGEHERAIEAFEHSLALLEGYDPYEAARTRAQWRLALVGAAASHRESICCKRPRPRSRTWARATTRE